MACGPIGLYLAITGAPRWDFMQVALGAFLVIVGVAGGTLERVSFVNRRWSLETHESPIKTLTPPEQKRS